MGTYDKSGPRPATKAARKMRPAPMPKNAGRQPWKVPTARTIVKASTTSTKDARNAAETAGQTTGSIMVRPSTGLGASAAKDVEPAAASTAVHQATRSSVIIPVAM